MDRPTKAAGVTLVTGLLLGALVTFWLMLPSGVNVANLDEFFRYGSELSDPPQPPLDWTPPEPTLQTNCQWVRLMYSEQAWSVEQAPNYASLETVLTGSTGGSQELVIPIFPSVYAPNPSDKVYYDYLPESGIGEGDKVLVIGAGTGADAWAASLVSKAPVYVVEINPLAVVNIRATARLGGFEVRPFLGDATTAELPDDFSGFDYVLWNMPFLEEGSTLEEYADRNHHDGDDGSILRAFLRRLPSLVKEGGTAILLNFDFADPYFTDPRVIRREGYTDGKVQFVLYVVPDAHLPLAPSEQPQSPNTIP